MNRNHIISLAVFLAALIVAAVAILFAAKLDETRRHQEFNKKRPVLRTVAEMKQYASPPYRMSFSYPAHLYLKKREAGTPERPQLALVLVENTEEHRNLLEGNIPEVPREGPPSIMIDVYQNPKKLTAAEWVREDTNWNLGDKATSSIVIAGEPGVAYRWSGLYEGKTAVVTRGSLAYVFSVTWLTPEDELIDDYRTLLASIRFE